MKEINGINAAWMEHNGTGVLSVKGRTVVFVSNSGLVAKWWCKTNNEAKQMVSLFRAATKYPDTRSA